MQHADALLIPPPPAWARAALEELYHLDPRLMVIEQAAGPLAWRQREAGFPGLLRAICGQMISNQAANAIWGRLAALPGALLPEALLALDPAMLRAAGLSTPKVGHARALAAAFAEGRLDSVALGEMPPAEAIAAIAAVPGLGPWSAEVHLLFGHESADIFPAGDLALAAAAAHLLGLPERPKEKQLRAMAEAWQPWRSLAARLLWHYWRHVTGRSVVEDAPAAPGGKLVAARPAPARKKRALAATAPAQATKPHTEAETKKTSPSGATRRKPAVAPAKASATKVTTPRPAKARAGTRRTTRRDAE